jgi:hypothetical protein
MNLVRLAVIGVVTVFASAAPADDKTAVVPEDTKPFKVDEGEIVRLTGRGIAGAKIEIKVEGPAKVEAAYNVTVRKNGTMPIGASVREFDLVSTGKGTVKVTITVTNPTGGPTDTKYEYEVR